MRLCSRWWINAWSLLRFQWIDLRHKSVCTEQRSSKNCFAFLDGRRRSSVLFFFCFRQSRWLKALNNLLNVDTARCCRFTHSRSNTLRPKPPHSKPLRNLSKRRALQNARNKKWIFLRNFIAYFCLSWLSCRCVYSISHEHLQAWEICWCWCEEKKRFSLLHNVFVFTSAIST